MSKPIQIAAMSIPRYPGGGEQVSLFVLLDDGRIFQHFEACGERRWGEVKGPWIDDYKGTPSPTGGVE